MSGGRRGKGGDWGGQGRQLTEDGVLLGVLVTSVRADERAEVVVLHGILIPEVKCDCQHDPFKRPRNASNLRLDKLAPLLLALLALHPVLVQLCDALIWLFEELGEFLLHVLEDLVIQPVRECK